ncbi:receptor-like protein 7 [Neltuma alba]|uniref:receptor-like protein 7 n=1 Tax=Neltuma alba TaxID=207710 RepID=UPI0010A41EF1|nr:receptor-like protein 7 [Prosopis alba]
MNPTRTIDSIIFLVLFCFISLSINVFVANGHQQSALLHLKNSLTFNPAKSQKLVHWNQNYSCCEWSGVTCNKGRVIALDLSEESISGGLDSSSGLFNLTYMQDLNLAYNDFHSVVPSKLHELKSLRYLNLSNAGFEGHIPIEISRLTRLVSLDLSTSLHTLKLESPNITNLLQNLTKITTLYMDGMRILAEGKEWGRALSSLKNLQILSLSSCNLSGPIDSSLSKLQSLLVLRLNQNNLASLLPESFASLTNLTTLQLNSCNLSGVFPIRIFQLPNLQVIDVSNNQDLHGSLPEFSHHGSFNTLNLSHTSFSGKLPDCIHKLRELSTLDLSSCQFNGMLPKSMSELTQLVHLDLSFNNFTGPLPYFNMSKILRFLSVSINHMTGEIPSSHFNSLDNLISIDLVGNSFYGRVPSSLFSLPSLQELMLSHNRFEGVLDEFPTRSVSSLEFLDANGNNLQGPIPLSIFRLRRLRVLQLSLNKFNGTMRLVTIKRMENLEILDLSHNNLLVDATLRDNDDLSSFPKLSQLKLASCKLKDFPRFLRNQSNLRGLDLSSNHIEGVIPNWIWRFEFMDFLNLSNNLLTDLEGPFHNNSSNLFLIDLHSNQLLGPTPVLSGSVIYLDLSSNRFSHIAPSDIGNQLPFLYFLSLSNNSLHGQIHESLCNISTLRILDLSNNGLNGTIPECLTRISSTLRVLNLAKNKFKGQISDTFSNSCSLRFLDLNENFFEGFIPKSLANCQKLQVLNLGNNQLTDRFPCFLNNVSTLKVMILRSNNFHGPLDCPHSIGNWETLQIVDLASNNFRGKLPGSFLQSLKALMLEDESSSKFGHLVFEIFDNVSPMDIRSAWTPIANKDLALKLAKLINIGMPPNVINHLFYDAYVELLEIRSYQDSVTIVNKGRQVKLVKILIAFTSLDFSSNHFEGSIPKELMDFKALHALNLSENAFSSHIPSSVGDLNNLESLDLSMNSFKGKIPTELASLLFLAVLNLSFNHLIGPIPTGTQIQSFGADSFEGNEGLCGPPLTQTCSFGVAPGLSSPSSETSESISSKIPKLLCELVTLFPTLPLVPPPCTVHSASVQSVRSALFIDFSGALHCSLGVHTVRTLCTVHRLFRCSALFARRPYSVRTVITFWRSVSFLAHLRHAVCAIQFCLQLPV